MCTLLHAAARSECASTAYVLQVLVDPSGEAVPSRLCQQVSSSSSVLSASLCQGLESLVTPQPTSAYSDTRCDWASQRVRPMLVMPALRQCRLHR